MVKGKNKILNKGFYERLRIRYNNKNTTINLCSARGDNNVGEKDLDEFWTCGERKTQAEWLRYSKKAIRNGDFYIPSLPVLYSIIKLGHDNKDEKTGKWIKGRIGINSSDKNQDDSDWNKCLLSKPIMTSTRIHPLCSGEYKITHNYGMPNQYTKTTRFKRQKGLLKKCLSSENSEALFGNSDVDEIDFVLSWVTSSKVSFEINNYSQHPVVLDMTNYTKRHSRIDCSKCFDIKTDSIGIFEYETSKEEELFKEMARKLKKTEKLVYTDVGMRMGGGILGCLRR